MIKSRDFKITLRNIFTLVIIIVSILILSEFFLNNSIKSSETKFYTSQLELLIDNLDYDNDLLKSKKTINNKLYLKFLGSNQEKSIYIAKKDSVPIAVILNCTAPDGYSGNIDLMVAIKLKNKTIINNTIYKTVVLHHNETPGLGDKIEHAKSNWIQQFTNKFITESNNNWQVKHDIDSISGATITSKAVTSAIKQSLLLINQHPEILKDE